MIHKPKTKSPSTQSIKHLVSPIANMSSPFFDKAPLNIPQPKALTQNENSKNPLKIETSLNNSTTSTLKHFNAIIEGGDNNATITSTNNATITKANNINYTKPNDIVNVIDNKPQQSGNFVNKIFKNFKINGNTDLKDVDFDSVTSSEMDSISVRSEMIVNKTSVSNFVKPTQSSQPPNVFFQKINDVKPREETNLPQITTSYNNSNLIIPSPVKNFNKPNDINDLNDDPYLNDVRKKMNNNLAVNSQREKSPSNVSNMSKSSSYVDADDYDVC